MLSSTLRVRRGGARSWLDYQWSRAFGARLAARLEERCQGERGVFITLTYQREHYDNPKELYQFASEKKHVAEFMKRLSRFLGEKLSGRWICKLEFQEGGWIHWHLILLGTTRIQHSELERLWGHGYVWIERMNSKNIKYMAKYVAKGDGFPAFLYAEKPRSVKIIRTSKGFWNEPPVDRPPPKPKDEQFQLDAYRPIGESLRIADSTTVVVNDEGQYRSFMKPLDQVIGELVYSGYKVVSRDGAWLELERDGGRSGASRRPPRLHLIRRQNRGSQSGVDAWPEWLIQCLSETLDAHRWLA